MNIMQTFVLFVRPLYNFLLFLYFITVFSCVPRANKRTGIH